MKSPTSTRKSKITYDQGLFRVLIESVEPDESFIQLFWSPASYPGQAIESVLKACIRRGIRNPIARELDYVHFNPSRDKAVLDKKSNVFYARERIYFPTEKSFIAPFGIIASPQRGERDYELIKEGFYLSKNDDIYDVEAAIEDDKLFSTFVELINRLPSIRVFWIKLAADWEDSDREEFWTNEKLNSSESITTFLTTNSRDTVQNGHVALTAYSDVGQTNLSIDTHKTIKVLTKSAKIQRTMAAVLRSLGFKELSRFYSLEYGYHHWHHRPFRSKSRTRLVSTLKKAGFNLWKSQSQAESTQSDNTT